MNGIVLSLPFIIEFLEGAVISSHESGRASFVIEEECLPFGLVGLLQ